MIAFALLMLVGACIGQTTVDPTQLHAGAKRLFDLEDRNGDGFITKVEAYQHLLAHDNNNDGKLSRHEFTELICAETPRLYPVSHYIYDHYDVNHDHFVDTPDIDIYFPRADTNNDGKIDFNEYTHVVQQDYFLGVGVNCTHPEAGHLGVLTVVTHISWLSIKTVKK